MLVSAFGALYLGESTPFAGPWDAVLGMCVGAGAVSIVGWLGEVWLKRPAIGFGDVTLMAVVGAAVGPARALLTSSLPRDRATFCSASSSALGSVLADAGTTELALAARANGKRELPFAFLAPLALSRLFDTRSSRVLRISGL